MPFVLLDKNNVVIQKQPHEQDGFIEVDDDVVCGQILSADGKFVNPTPSSEIVKAKRKAEILAALDDIDWRTIRPLRAGEMDKVEELELQAQALREELETLK